MDGIFGGDACFEGGQKRLCGKHAALCKLCLFGGGLCG